jgi:hypothetical protein
MTLLPFFAFRLGNHGKPCSALLLLALLVGCGSSPMRLSSPLDYQVFQRQTKEAGIIKIQGESLIPADSVEAHFLGQSITGPLPDKWYPITLDKTSQTFQANIPIPAGGFYKLTIRTKKGGVLLSEETVSHIGVGEVFVVSGQSNSTNYGEVRQKTRTRMVTAVGPHGWQIANDPQPGVQDDSTNGSFIPSFGDAMYRKYGVPIGIASVGHGSTSVRQWLPEATPVFIMPTWPHYIYNSAAGLACDGTLYNGMLAQIKAFGEDGFRAVLWHQGESDSHQPPDNNISADIYENMMLQVISGLRKDAGWDFPWFVAEATYNNPNDQATPEIEAAQQDLWISGPALQGPDTDALTMQYRDKKGTSTHFNNEGLQIHGQMWADKVGVYLDQELQLNQ